ncbi:hypothetical protein MCP1_400024 [Candidatus Terasakiella magnetica]|nr:hypothetical protein MCP1_400024 [Candidatus Terasakiella magnetica]
MVDTMVKPLGRMRRIALSQAAEKCRLDVSTLYSVMPGLDPAIPAAPPNSLAPNNVSAAARRWPRQTRPWRYGVNSDVTVLDRRPPPA